MANTDWFSFVEKPPRPAQATWMSTEIERPPVGTNARPDLPLAVVVGAGGMAMAIARRLGPSYRLLIADRDEKHLIAQKEVLHGERRA